MITRKTENYLEEIATMRIPMFSAADFTREQLRKSLQATPARALPATGISANSKNFQKKDNSKRKKRKQKAAKQKEPQPPGLDSPLDPNDYLPVRPYTDLPPYPRAPSIDLSDLSPHLLSSSSFGIALDEQQRPFRLEVLTKE